MIPCLTQPQAIVNKEWYRFYKAQTRKLPFWTYSSHTMLAGFQNGAHGWDRTTDLCRVRTALLPLSYARVIRIPLTVFCCGDLLWHGRYVQSAVRLATPDPMRSKLPQAIGTR